MKKPFAYITAVWKGGEFTVIDIGRELLRRSHVLIVCGDEVDESVKNDIAVAQRLGITATTLDGILKIHAQGENEVEG